MSRSNPNPKEMFNIMTQKYLDNILKNEDGISELEVKFGTRGVKEITKDDFDNVVKKLISTNTLAFWICSYLHAIVSRCLL